MRIKAEKTTTATRPLFRKESQGQELFFQGRRPGTETERVAAGFFPGIQPKLEISRPDDPYEKEADQMSETVMRAAEADREVPQEEETKGNGEIPVTIQAKSCACQDEVQRVQAMAAPGFFPEPSGSWQETDASDSEAVPSLQIQPKGEEESASKPDRGPPGRAPPLEERLLASKGGGMPMPSGTREFMETRFGADFSSVRIHTDGEAQRMATEIHAQAFTHGRDIYFNAGKYAPESDSGKRLLAHELTHTLQQGGASSVQPIRIRRKESGAEAARQAAVDHARGEKGKVNADQSGPDGNRQGWERLKEYFETSLGKDKVIPATAAFAPGVVSEADIRKKRMIEGPVPAHPERPAAAGPYRRDALPSWCGIFAFWALHKGGIPMKTWRLGEPIIGPEAAYGPGYKPRPGDIAYKQDYSHFALVEQTVGDQVRTINGNTSGEDNMGAQVEVREDPLSVWHAFFNPLELAQGEVREPQAKEERQSRELREIRQAVFGIDRKPEQGQAPESATEPGSLAVSASGELISRSVSPPSPAEPNRDSGMEKEKEEEGESQSAPGLVSRKAAADRPLQSLSRGNLARMPESEGRRELSGSSGAILSASPVPRTGEGDGQGHSRGVGARAPPSRQRTSSERIQCGWFSDALAWVDSAIDYVAEGLNRGKELILAEARDFAMAIPGYKALRVVLGEDPITGQIIPRNGYRFLEAALDIIPGGRILQDKLEEMGLMSRAAAWIDDQILAWKGMVHDVLSAIQRFWNQLSLRDLASPIQVFERAGQILHSTIIRLVDIALDAARSLLELIKEVLVDQVAGFIEENTSAYPLLRVILGQDPIRGEPVPRNGHTILEAMLALGGEEGREQKRQMMETGTWTRATAWIDEGISVFQGSYEQIRMAFHQVWDMITLSSLTQPLVTFRRVLGLFGAPVSRVLGFMGRTISTILGFIKNALMQRLSQWARGTRGYPLLTVILGQDPFSGEPVPRNADRLVRGFLSLMEGGEEQYQQLKASGAIARASQQILVAVHTLNMTRAYIRALFLHTWNQFGFADLAQPLQAFARIIACFADPIRRLIRFVVRIVRIVVEFLLQLMQFPIGLISRIMAQAMESFQLIRDNPVGFLKNLMAAIKQGFVQFFRNIGRHLVQGLVGWLMSELREAGVPVLQDFSLGGVVRWVLEVLGITVERIWQKLAEHPQIGPGRVARIRGMLDRVEGIWTFLRDVQQRGLVAIWEWIQERLTQLWDTVMNAVKEWVMERIVTQMVARLLSLLDPTGIMAVVNSAIALFRAVQSFVRYLREMLEIVASFVEGVLEIAQGSLQTAANALENSLARSVPIVIGFLANQLGLSGIGRRIGEMLLRVREMVDQALTWLVNKAVRLALPALQRLISFGRSVGDRILGWLGIRRQVQMLNGETHTLYFDDSGEEPVLMMASSPRRYRDFVQSFQATTPELQAHKEAALSIAGDIDRLIRTRRRTEDGQRDDTHNGTRIAALIDQLVVHTRHFQVTGGNQPPSVVRYGPVNDHGGGSFAHAEILSRENIQGGSPSGKPRIMQLAERRRPAASFIQGHLLNDNLGGKGNSYNLTPITGVMARVNGSCANTRHLNLVERHVKGLVLGEGKVVDYRVEARYGGHGRQRSFHRQLLEKQRDGTATPLELWKLEIMEYEDRHLCTELVNTWCLRERDPQTGEWVKKEDSCQTVVVPNELPDGDFETPPPP